MWNEYLDFFFKKQTNMFEKLDFTKKDWWQQLDSKGNIRGSEIKEELLPFEEDNKDKK